MSREAAYARIREAVQQRANDLLATSHAIHADPEIRFEEVRASARLRELLSEGGFEVRHPVGGLDTAFVARIAGGAGSAGSGTGSGTGPRVGIVCEYDALEGLGHACGHNVIATIGAGAGLALAREMSELAGELSVIGCPAEEGGGGKAYLLDAGVFDGLNAVTMIHPLSRDLQGWPALARIGWDVTFRGRPAHAALAPHLGVNALDAVRLAFAGIDAMRQQVRPDVRMHGIVTHGGDAANVVPERAALRLMVRAAERDYLFEVLIPRARAVMEGAARMTGCEVEIAQVGPAYENLRPNRALEERYAELAQRVGRQPAPVEGLTPGGSTDMGNVSQRVPALHAYIAIDDEAEPHTAAFREAARSPRADQAIVDGAELLACLSYDLLTDAEFRVEVAALHAAAS